MAFNFSVPPHNLHDGFILSIFGTFLSAQSNVSIILSLFSVYFFFFTFFYSLLTYFSVPFFLSLCLFLILLFLLMSVTDLTALVSRDNAGNHWTIYGDRNMRVSRTKC